MLADRIEGSTLHALKSLAHPRWEDYSYEAADPVQNRFYWLGDGQTHNEKTLTGDSTFHLIFTAHNELGSDDMVRVIGAWYLREPFLDVPPSEYSCSGRRCSDADVVRIVPSV